MLNTATWSQSKVPVLDELRQQHFNQMTNLMKTLHRWLNHVYLYTKLKQDSNKVAGAHHLPNAQASSMFSQKL